MIVYIAGPMSGIPEFNYPAFNRAEDQLRAIGHEPINPARHGDDHRAATWTWVDFMRRTIRDVTQADAIHLLDGWEQSRGARLEEHISQALGLPRIGSAMPGKDADVPPRQFDTFLAKVLEDPEAKEAFDAAQRAGLPDLDDDATPTTTPTEKESA